jgi:ABC-2 type transport system permease protein
VSAAVAAAPGGVRSDARRGPTFPRVVASEWTKLVSLRAPWWTGGVTVVVAGVITYLSAQASSVDLGFDPVDSLGTGLALAQVGALVLGVLAGAGEFRTGAARTTFTAVPRRWPVVAAQVLATAAFAAVVAVLSVAASVVGLLPPAARRGVAVDVWAGETPGVMLGMGLFVVGLTLLGLAVGVLLRRTVPAMVTTLVVVLVLPVVLTMMSDPLIGGDPATAGAPPVVDQVTLGGTLMVLTPGGAAQLMMFPASSGPMEGAPDIGPVGGGLVLAAWVLVLLVAAVLRLRLRDVR